MLIRKALTLGLLVAGLSTLPMSAQEFRGTMAGQVMDPAGHAVSGAAVTVHSTQEGTDHLVKTGDNGHYQVPFLVPGTYDVIVQKAGFADERETGVSVSVAQTTELDVALKIASAQTEVNVTAEPPLIDTQSANRGLTIDSERVQNTPMQAQNIFEQSWSAPGVAVGTAVQELRGWDNSGMSHISINGSQSPGSEALIDGISVTYEGGNVGYMPPAAGVQEFRVQTSAYDAQYGWTSGGVINATTKAGTNTFHGSAYEFLQNTILNANTYGQNLNRTPRLASHVNNFGGAVGGPILKKKLFGFFTYDEYRQAIPYTWAFTVPTARQKTGDFSQTYYANNGTPQLQVIYNPFTTRTDPKTGQLIRDPFPGNVIPQNLLNPVAVNILKGLPLGNVPGDPITGANNLVNSASSPKYVDYFDNWLVRGDYAISENSTLFVRYSRNKLSQSNGWIFSTNSQVNPFDTASTLNRENHNAAVGFTHIFSPTMTLDVRLGLERYLSRTANTEGAGYGLEKLGFSSNFASEAYNQVPQFGLSGYASIGGSPLSVSPQSQTNTFSALIYKQLGRQTLRFGGAVFLERVYVESLAGENGSFSFGPKFTGSNPNSTNSNTGNAIADFLLGTPSSGSISVNTSEARQQLRNSLFVQDDIRISDRLTLNAGLRWDIETLMTDRHNAVARGFDFNATSPLQPPGMMLKGGLLYAGVNGVPRGIYDNDWNNFGPRLGAAYRINDKTVARGGYGLVYSQTFDDPGNAPGFNATTSMVTSVQTGVPYNTLTDPFPGGILKPVGSSLGLSANLGQSLSFANPARRLPWTEQYSLEFQRELPKRTVASVAYVGSHSEDLPVSRSINEVSLADFEKGATYLNASVPNPFAGLLPGTGLNASTTTRYQLLRPYPQFTSITESVNSVGSSTYNALQAMLQTNFSRVTSASIAYTYSKTLGQTDYANAQDTKLEKVVPQHDIPHSIQINAVWSLPFGKGQRFGATAPSVPRMLISGWRISALARMESGIPLPAPSGVMPTGVNPNIAHPTLMHWFNTCTLLSNGKMQNCEAGENIIDNPASDAPQVRRIPPVDSKNEAANDPAVQVHMGVAYSLDGSALYAPTGDTGAIDIYDTASWRHVGRISLDGPVGAKTYKDSFCAVVVLSPDGKKLYALDQGNWRVVIIDLATRQIAGTMSTGSNPLALALSPDGSRVYVANSGLFEYQMIGGVDMRALVHTGLRFPAFGYPSKEARNGTTVDGHTVPGLGDENDPRGSSLWTYDVTTPERPRLIRKLRLGRRITEGRNTVVGGASPSGVVASKNHVYVSLAHEDSIAVVSADGTKFEQEIPLSPFTGDEFKDKQGHPLRGVMPFGVALAGKRLYVAETGINSVAVIDTDNNQVLTHIPVGWYPAAVAVAPDGSNLYVVNNRGKGSGPSAGPSVEKISNRSIEALERGSLTRIPLPLAESNLASYTASTVKVTRQPLCSPRRCRI